MIWLRSKNFQFSCLFPGKQFSINLSNWSFLNLISFSLDPNNAQPTGAINFTKIANSKLEITLGRTSQGNKDSSDDTIYIYVYAMNYNILKIQAGSAGLAYRIQ